MYKKIIILLIIFFNIFFPIKKAYAHLVGQPPFFRINGVFSNYYQVPSGSYIALSPFPQDIAPERYLTHTPIELGFDLTQLEKVVPLEIINKTTFVWNFGDGTTGEGQKNIHIYEKPGSYVLSITADTRTFEANAEPQVIQSVLLNVFDSDTYLLPKTHIFINGLDGKNISGDWLEINLGRAITVDGTATESGSTPIASYEWDFGDGALAKGKTAIHKYLSAPESIMVILRVRDQNGFIIDTASGLVHNPTLLTIPTPTPDHLIGQGSSTILQSKSIIVIIILLCGILLLIHILRRK